MISSIACLKKKPRAFSGVPLSLTICALSFLVSGCVSQEQFHNFIEERGNIVRARFAADRSAERRELETKSPCCDDLRTANPLANVSGERPLAVTLGSWPSTQIVEIDGFRSYYAFVAVGSYLSNKYLVVDSQSTVTGLVDTKTGFREGWMLVPVVTFFDEKRQRIQSVGATLTQIPGGLYWRAKFAVPVEAVFAAVHTSSEMLNGPKLSGTVAA